MSRDRQRLGDYLAHILEAIERVDRYTSGMEELEFSSNPLVQDAVIRNLEIIGEASNDIERLYPEFAAEHRELPLSIAYQMRNALADGYFQVDFEIVWRAIRRDLPGLQAQVRTAAAGLPGAQGL